MVNETVFGSVLLALESTEESLLGSQNLDSRSGVLGEVNLKHVLYFGQCGHYQVHNTY